MMTELGEVKHRSIIYNIPLLNVFTNMYHLINLNIHHDLLLSPGVFVSSNKCKMIYEVGWSRWRNIEKKSKYSHAYLFLVSFYSLNIFRFVSYIIKLYFSCFLVHSQQNVIIIVYIREDSITW